MTYGQTMKIPPDISIVTSTTLLGLLKDAAEVKLELSDATLGDLSVEEIEGMIGNTKSRQGKASLYYL